MVSRAEKRSSQGLLPALVYKVQMLGMGPGSPNSTDISWMYAVRNGGACVEPGGHKVLLLHPRENKTIRRAPILAILDQLLSLN